MKKRTVKEQVLSHLLGMMADDQIGEPERLEIAEIIALIQGWKGERVVERVIEKEPAAANPVGLVPPLKGGSPVVDQPFTFPGSPPDVWAQPIGPKTPLTGDFPMVSNVCQVGEPVGSLTPDLPSPARLSLDYTEAVLQS